MVIHGHPWSSMVIHGHPWSMFTWEGGSLFPWLCGASMLQWSTSLRRFRILTPILVIYHYYTTFYIPIYSNLDKISDSLTFPLQRFKSSIETVSLWNMLEQAWNRLEVDLCAWFLSLQSEFRYVGIVLVKLWRRRAAAMWAYSDCCAVFDCWERSPMSWHHMSQIRKFACTCLRQQVNYIQSRFCAFAILYKICKSVFCYMSCMSYHVSKIPRIFVFRAGSKNAALDTALGALNELVPAYAAKLQASSHEACTSNHQTSNRKHRFQRVVQCLCQFSMADHNGLPMRDSMQTDDRFRQSAT